MLMLTIKEDNSETDIPSRCCNYK